MNDEAETYKTLMRDMLAEARPHFEPAMAAIAACVERNGPEHKKVMDCPVCAPYRRIAAAALGY